MSLYCSGGFYWGDDGTWGCEVIILPALTFIKRIIEHKINIYLSHFRQHLNQCFGGGETSLPSFCLELVKWLWNSKRNTSTEMLYNFFRDPDWNASTPVGFREQWSYSHSRDNHVSTLLPLEHLFLPVRRWKWTQRTNLKMINFPIANL